MIKALSAVAVAAFIATALTVLPGFAPQVEASVPVALAKGDRLDIKQVAATARRMPGRILKLRACVPLPARTPCAKPARNPAEPHTITALPDDLLPSRLLSIEKSRIPPGIFVFRLHGRLPHTSSTTLTLELSRQIPMQFVM
jgi:hypothetical protein